MGNGCGGVGSGTMSVGRYPAGASATHGAVGLDPSGGETRGGVVTNVLGRYPVGAATTLETVPNGKATI